MTELDLARELGLIKKRSNSFNNTVILNQRLVNHILSLKKEKEEEIEEIFELAEEEDISPMSTSHLAKQEEKIFELKPIANFVWQQTEHRIEHPVYERKVSNFQEYAERRRKEMDDNELEEKLNALSNLLDEAG